MESSGITPVNSNQQLVGSSDNDSATTLLQGKPSRTTSLREVSLKEFMTVGILCYINLINYMDRFTLAGVLEDVKDEFKINDSKAGLLQTVFVIAYMIFAPIFGYLGDRYSRKYIMAAGIALWSFTTFAGSYITNFHLFMLFRGLVGIGEASYSTIAPTIISDLFVGNVRSKMLAFFYFAIPVGSGLGYITGSTAGAAAGNWRWGLRVTPMLGAVAVGLVVWLLKEPERGQAEDSHIQPTSYMQDVKALSKNASFMLSSLAFTCVAFVTGALAWWGPDFIYCGLQLQKQNTTLSRVSLLFGVVTMVSGIIGVPLGAWLGASLQKRYPRSHPLICGVGLLISAPAIVLALTLAEEYQYAPFALMFFGELALNLNWAIVADMSLYVVVPPRRSTAEAFQILISHMFGDAGSPYLVGVISDALKSSMSSGIPDEVTTRVKFQSLQYALFVTCFVEVLGGILFLVTAFYIVKDKMRVDRAIADSEAATREPSHNAAIDDISGE